MKIKIIMDSGKIYSSELDASIAGFFHRLAEHRKESVQNYIVLDEAGNIAVNIAHISSVEAIE